MPTTNTRLDPALAALGILAPVAMLIAVFSYSCDRARAAWRDERGLSHTVEVTIWVGIAVGVVIVVGGVVVLAITNRSKQVGNDVENKQLP